MFSFVMAYIIAIASLARRAVKSGCDSHHRKIVIFDADIDPRKHDSIVESCGGCVKKALPLINAAACVFPEEDQAMALLARHGEVKWIEDDTVFAIVDTPAPDVKKCVRCFGVKRPGFSTQTTPWGVTKIDAPTVWARATGKGVRVGVVDTGVNMSHPDLAVNVKTGFDAISETEGVEDDNGHGTHVAGIIAALDNGFGVVGVAPEAHICAVKSFDSKGKGMASDIIQGIAWCIDQGVSIINMSFGTVDSGKALELAISKAAEAGILLVAASGNTGGQNTVLYPARDPHVVAVAASTQDDQIAAFSSSGPEVDITGPGTDIYSTYAGQRYKTLTGTSMACPHVTGVAALVLSAVPGLSAKEVEELICETATVINGFPRDQQGAGLINARAAVASVMENRL